MQSLETAILSKAHKGGRGAENICEPIWARNCSESFQTAYSILPIDEFK